MQTVVRKLEPAQHEVHHAAHNQDLVEVPRRAQLDRIAERRRIELQDVEPVHQDQ